MARQEQYRFGADPLPALNIGNMVADHVARRQMQAQVFRRPEQKAGGRLTAITLPKVGRVPILGMMGRFKS